jgi:hypothetical protein
MSSTTRFVVLSLAWAFGLPLFTVGIFTGSGNVALVMLIATAVLILLPGSFWVASGMRSTTRWDLAAKCVAMLLLLVLCLAGVTLLEFFLFRSNNAGVGWN